MAWKKILEKFLEYKRVIFEIIIILALGIAIYSYITKPSIKEEDKAEIIKIQQERVEYYNNIKDIKRVVDSLHVEQRYTIEKIDGTLYQIKKLEVKRNEKINHYTSNVDSTVEFLSNRYKNRIP